MTSLRNENFEWVVEQVTSGDCVLFLGAGASFSCKTSSGTPSVRTEELKERLCDRYLNGKFKSASLAKVAELAKSEKVVTEVQEYIADLYKDLEPTSGHKVIPSLRWSAIVTTNFDLAVEKSYQENSRRRQMLMPVVKDGDLRDASARANSLPLIKLHGCVTKAKEKQPPFILASEEYAKFRFQREQIFSAFRDLAESRTVIFCGYQLADENISQILWDIGDTSNQRPRYVLVDPALDPIEERYWAERRVLPFKQTCEDFLISLDNAIPEHKRSVSAAFSKTPTPLSKLIASTRKPSESLSVYLATELEYVHSGMQIEGVKAEEFYNGFTHSWSVIQSDFDVRRRVTDDFIIESIVNVPLDEEPRFYVLKGYAGGGKSVMLMRIAWEAATDFSAPVFFLKENGDVEIDLLIELQELINSRIYLFVHDVPSNHEAIHRLIQTGKKRSIPVTIIGGARFHEWNVWCEEIEPYVDEEYQITNLSESEVESLVDKLEGHDCLGEIGHYTRDERLNFFELTAQRQLLVALHEAMSNGARFEDIVFNEYESIFPPAARQLYLDVCTLNRFGVGVRAGLISRVSNISFVDFKDHFLRPLQHVVRIPQRRDGLDYVYRARHSIIAELVFSQALKEPEDQANQLTRVLSHMNLEYRSDEIAFHQIIGGNKIAEAFVDKRLVDLIFSAALKASADESYVRHQQAIAEMNHPSGDLSDALKLIQEAERIFRKRSGVESVSILHTKANIYRKLALKAQSESKRVKFRKLSSEILKAQLRGAKTSHAIVSLIALQNDELADSIPERNDQTEKGDLEDRAIADNVAKIEELLERAGREFPDDEFLKAEEAKFSELLGNSPRTRRALEGGLATKPWSPFIVVRLARLYYTGRNQDKAVSLLEEALHDNPSSKRLHWHLARFLMKRGYSENRRRIEEHLKRSFKRGDRNFERQFWYARHCYLFGDWREGKGIFDQISRAPVYVENKNRKRGVIQSDGGVDQKFKGKVKTLKGNYAFVEIQEFEWDVFLLPSDIGDADFDKFVVGDEVELLIAFTFRGPSAMSVDRQR